MADFSHYGIPSPEWQELLQSTPLVPTTRAPDQTVEDLQRTTNAARETASAQFLEASGLRDQVQWNDHQIPTRDGQTIPARVYRANNPVNNTSSLPVYLFFHGGGFLFGTLSSEEANCARLASELPIIVIHVCYRHTPRFSHPTQANDAWDAFEWACAHLEEIGGDPDRLIVGGVSAGGGLAASVVLRENQISSGKGRIAGQILCIPWLCHPDVKPDQIRKDCGSYDQNKDAPILPREQIDLFIGLLGVRDPRDMSIFAGHACDDDLEGMPKTVLLIAGMDPLRDEALIYADRLNVKRVPTRVHVFAGLPHGFYRYVNLPSTTEWFKQIEDGIRWTLESK